MKQVSSNRSLQESNGTSQGTRLTKMLLPDYVKIDERNTKDLLAATTRYAHLLNLHNLKNEVVGDWYHLLNNDISVLLANIADTNWEKIDQERIELINSIEKSFVVKEKIDFTETFFKQILNLTHLIDGWYKQATNLNNTENGVAIGIEMELQNAIKFRLSKQLKILQSYDLGAKEGFGEAIGLSYKGLSRVWDMDKHIPTSNNIYKQESPKNNDDTKQQKISDSERINIAIKKIRLVYRAFYSTLRYIVQSVPKHFYASLETKSDHRPDIALLITFLRLFKYTQDHLNTLTFRHLNLYYYDILKQKELDCQPDKVHICFELAKHAHSYTIQKDTRFLAGKNNIGDDRVYTANEDIVVTKANIQSLKTVFISKNLALEVSSFRLVTGIFAAPYANSLDGLGMEFKSDDAHWSTFGSEQSVKSKAERQMIDAKIGFAIASPILFLSEGERNVTITITFEHESLVTFNRLILDISQKDETSKENAFNKVFTNNFNISLSGLEGWINVDRYEISPPKNQRGGNEFTINFTLPPSVPAIVAPNPKVLGERFISKWPIAKFTLNEKSAIYSYSFLRDLEIETIYIDVNCKKLKNLNLFNNVGQLDASTPFQMFGAVPLLDSYLLIGNNEIFKKELTDLQLHLEWQGLPLGHGGFKAHYGAYGIDMENSSFKVQLSALSNNEFHPLRKKDRQTFSLFKTTEKKASNAIQPISSFSTIRLNKLDITPNPFLKPITTFDNKTRSGFFKLELTEPDIAFGHDLYPKVFTQTITENSKPPVKGGLLSSAPEVEEKPLPNQPYTPVIKALSVDYSASTEIHLSPSTRGQQSVKHEAQLFHIHPFGILNTYNKKAVKETHLLPQFDEDAYLYIGLKDLNAPEPLSILFQLRESPLSDQVSRPPEITWSYLANNQWHDFNKEQLLYDGTEGFMNSGIVNLEIPRAISKRNDILTSGLYWLRVSVKGDVVVLSSTIDIKAQAVQATWLKNNECSHLASSLPANELSGLEEKVPSIRKAIQPFPSFDGKPAEQQPEFYARVSERLRHKNRAVTHWEYEHLVLNKFSNITQVKCLTHNNYPEIPLGSIVLVVTPKSKNAANPYSPKVNFNILRTIKNYIKQYASAFADITVINPKYEHVKISCGVVFTEGNNNGQSLQLLNEQIQTFMCPWLTDDKAEISLGGSLNRDAIQHFIEQQSYVKFLSKLSMVQVVKDKDGFFLIDTAGGEQNISTIETTTPWSVLIPLEKHQIGFLEGEDYQAPEAASYETMSIGVDFVLGDDESELLEDDFHDFHSKNNQQTDATNYNFMQIDLDLD